MNQPPTALPLWIVLARCYKSLTVRVESVAIIGLCLTDFMILEALLHKGPLTGTEIQGKILLANGSMTVTVNSLEIKRQLSGALFIGTAAPAVWSSPPMAAD